MQNTKLSLLLGGHYDRTRALRDGTVSAQGYDLQVEVRGTTHEVFHTLCRSQEYDGGELSLSFYSTLQSKYGANSPFVGLPVFISRMFRHGNILVNRAAGIEAPSDLAGKVMGIPEYGMTMGVWLRGMLLDEYGVRPETITWLAGRKPVALREDECRYPDDVNIRVGGEQSRLVQMLGDGQTDAYIGPVPRVLPAGVKRLFPDYQAIERRYYAKTAIFPIMHVLVVRRERYRRDPGIAAALFRAFCRAKDLALDALWDSAALKVSLPWLIPAVEEQSAIFQGDLWPYGVERNRATLQAYVRHASQQGLLWKPLTVDELFLEFEQD